MNHIHKHLRKENKNLSFLSKINCDTSVAVALCCTHLWSIVWTPFRRSHICHLLTSLSLSSPRVVQMNAGPTDNDEVGIEGRVTLPFLSFYDSLTRFLLSSVPHVSGRDVQRILLPHKALSSNPLHFNTNPANNCSPNVSITQDMITLNPLCCL